LRIVRYLLQGGLLLMGGFVLWSYARSPAFEWPGFFAFAGFFGFLLLLTLMLREVTETRLDFRRVMNRRIFAVFLLLVGLGVCWFAVEIASGYVPEPRYRFRREFLRVLIEHVGPWPPAALFLAAGLSILKLAYDTFRHR
jgi:hypothetical protein